MHKSMRRIPMRQVGLSIFCDQNLRQIMLQGGERRTRMVGFFVVWREMGGRKDVTTSLFSYRNLGWRLWIRLEIVWMNGCPRR